MNELRQLILSLPDETVLALNGYFEAAGEYQHLGEPAYVAVMAVVLNRAAHPGGWADTVQAVVAQQTRDGKWVMPGGSLAADQWPQSPQEVIAAFRQFSWTNWDTIKDPQYPMALKFARSPERIWNKLWLAAKDVAQRVVNLEVKNPVKNATFYFNPHLCAPSWAQKLKLIRDLGNHRFMSDPGCDPEVLWPCPREGEASLVIYRLTSPMMQGEAVFKIKCRLNHLGYLENDQTNWVFDPKTDAAVKAFQRTHGLESDGKVGPLTMKALGINL